MTKVVDGKEYRFERTEMYFKLYVNDKFLGSGTLKETRDESLDMILMEVIVEVFSRRRNDDMVDLLLDSDKIHSVYSPRKRVNYEQA